MRRTLFVVPAVILGLVWPLLPHYVVVVMMSDSYLGAADLTALNRLASAAMRRAAA